LRSARRDFGIIYRKSFPESLIKQSVTAAVWGRGESRFMGVCFLENLVRKGGGSKKLGEGSAKRFETKASRMKKEVIKRPLTGAMGGKWKNETNKQSGRHGTNDGTSHEESMVLNA